jgi:hypothetical protein
MSEGVVQLLWKKRVEERASETAYLFPWRATPSEKCPASSFCSRGEVSRLESGSVIDGLGLPGAFLERTA